MLSRRFRDFCVMCYKDLPFCSVFIDDIIVFSTRELEHKDHLSYIV